MKTTAYWLTIMALTVAAGVLWALNSTGANASQDVTTTYVYASGEDTVVRSTILDNSRYPIVLAKLECSGSDVNDMVEQCGAALRGLCPDGGVIKELGETEQGVIPARIEITVECRHEPAL